MDVPGVVSAALGEESAVAQIPLKGEDVLFLTPTRTLVYRAEGLLSDESVEEYPHDAERVVVTEGRRKAKISLEYGPDGDETLEVPAGRVNDVVPPVLAGVLNAAGVTGPGESVKGVYRFSELTLVVTSDRLVKHVGNAAWDEDYESIDYDAVTGFDAEEGSVASTLVFQTEGHTERIKVPNESFREVHDAVADALFAAHDVASAAEFAQLHEPEEPDPTPNSDISFADSGLAPIGASRDEAEDESEGAAAASAGGGSTPDDTANAAVGGDAGAATDSLTDTAGASGGERPPATDPSPPEANESAADAEPPTSQEPAVPDDELLAELRDVLASVERQEDALATYSDAVARQRAELDAQQEEIQSQRAELADQRHRIDALIDAIRD